MLPPRNIIIYKFPCKVLRAFESKKQGSFANWTWLSVSSALVSFLWVVFLCGVKYVSEDPPKYQTPIWTLQIMTSLPFDFT